MKSALESGEFDAAAVLAQLREQAWALGFSQIGVAGVDLSHAEAGLLQWLDNGFNGSMDYMAMHGLKRARPAELVPGTVRVITARMDYLPRDADAAWGDRERARLSMPDEAVISIYARGRDYHKVLRTRLQKLADQLADLIGPFGHRVFTDSAPVLEAELATTSGIGWRGKHTLVLSREAGSMFFLGEIYVDVALPLTEPSEAHCGRCTACLDVCPTQAIVAPYRLDARRCISYLTIEHDGAIPLELRAAIGNRIYGCDDCQLVCPWNNFSRLTPEKDFQARNGLDRATLVELFNWSEADFDERLRGSPIRRIGYERWLRNLAVGLGNAPRSPEVVQALLSRKDFPSEIVKDHVRWALKQHEVAI